MGRRLAGVVLAAGWLAACVTTGGSGERLDGATAFDGAGGEAIVIMGIMANDGGPVTAQAVWDLYDPALRKAAAKGTGAAGGASDRMWMRADAAAMPGERADAAHAVFRVQPGDYILTRLMGNVERRFRVTDIAGSTLLLRVRPGEIVYAGDFVIATTRVPLQVAAVNCNERAARAALAAYPGIKGEMRVARPETVPLAR